jgi:uncharacterized RDD family membrane protein YckC
VNIYEQGGCSTLLDLYERSTALNFASEVLQIHERRKGMLNTNIHNSKGTKKVTVVGFGPRLIATLIDGAMVGFLGFMLAFVIGFIVQFINMFNPGQANGMLELLIILCVLFFSIFYYIGFWTNDGQTMGNMIVGLKVIRMDGSRLSVGRALLRYIGYLISASLFSLGFLWAAFDPNRQGWHDKLAGTLVVYAETNFNATDKVDLIPSDYDRKGWVWGALWIISALFLPLGTLSGILTVGPYIIISLVKLIQNTF